MKRIVYSVPVLHLLASLFLPFTYWPEMFIWPFFMQNSWLPYRDFAMIHTPILPGILWVFYEVLGYSVQSQRIFGALLLALGNLVIVKFLVNNTHNRLLAMTGGVLFIFLSFAFAGNHVWFESLLAPLAVLCFWCHWNFLRRRQRRYLVCSGVLMGLMILTKQTAAYLLPVCYLVILVARLEHNTSGREMGKQVLSLTAPIVILVFLYLLVLAQMGILADFWRWGVEFVFLKPAAAQSTQNSYVLLPTKLQVLSLGVFFLGPFLLSWQSESRRLLLLSCWILFGGLFAFPRFEYWHFVPSLALFSLAAVLGWQVVNKKLALALLAIVLVSGFSIWQKNWTYFHSFLDQILLNQAEFITSNYPKSSLFILNGPDQLYFLTGKIPAVKPWIPQLPWYLEYYGDQFLDDIMKSPPTAIAYLPYQDQPVHGLGAYRPPGVVEYLQANYRRERTFPDGLQLWLKN